jgi:hypothetical protein
MFEIMVLLLSKKASSFLLSNQEISLEICSKGKTAQNIPGYAGVN